MQTSVNMLHPEAAPPVRLRRTLAAVWISLALHVALIALVQVAPQTALRVGEPAIEVRLVPTQDDRARADPGILRPNDAWMAPMATDAPAPQPAPPAEAPAEASEPAAVSPERTAAGEALDASDVAASAAAAPTLAIASAVDLTYYSARELDVQPRALRGIVPDYPPEADRERLSGKVRLALKLEADGRIGGIEILSAEPPGVFDASARDAFRDARFAPAQKDGRPVRARVVVEVVYDWAGRAPAP